MLSVTVSDPDQDFTDVFFYGGTEGNFVLIGSALGVPSGQAATVFWTGLKGDATYAWYAVTDDGEQSSQSPTWMSATGESATPVAVPRLFGISLLVGIAVLMGIGFRSVRDTK